MPHFLAVYTMQANDLARFRRLPKAEQDAVDAVGMPQWTAWEARNAAFLPDRGGMIGRTLRVSRDGTAAAVNSIGGYVIVEAASIEAAAQLFEDNPHINVFPGDGVDIMPFLTGPASVQDR